MPNSKDGRYRLHDLARLFAESCLEEKELFDVQQKHAKYYSKILAQAGDLYAKGGANTLPGLNLFDQEWTNIKVGQAWVKNSIRSYRKFTRSDLKSLTEMANSYGCNNILDLRLHPKELIEFIETGLAAARIERNRNAEGAHLGNLGNANADLGDTTRPSSI